MTEKKIYEKEFVLQLKDIDKNNNMRLSSYLNLMQEIGALHSAEFGYSLKDEPVTHKAWIVISWDLDIFRRPAWNEKIKVISWIGKIDKIYHYRDYEMVDSEGNIVAKGIAKWVMVDTVTKRIQKMDENYIKEFPVVERDGYNNNIDKINSKVDVNNLKTIYEYKVEKRDVDTNNHMNNIIYLDLALEGLGDEIIDNVSKIQIHYKTECKYNEEIVFMQGEDGVYVFDKNKEKLHTQVILK